MLAKSLERRQFWYPVSEGAYIKKQEFEIVPENQYSIAAQAWIEEWLSG